MPAPQEGEARDQGDGGHGLGLSVSLRSHGPPARPLRRRGRLILSLSLVVASWAVAADAEGSASRFPGSLADGVPAQKGEDTIRLMFGSCNKLHVEQPFWPMVTDLNPDVWVWLGDNIYADQRRNLTWVNAPEALMHSLQSGMNMNDFAFVPASPARIQELYAKQKSHPGYARVREQTRVIGTWDDHDYGINDGGETYTHREASQQLFLDFMDEPRDSPRRRQKGVYTVHKFPFGDGKEASVIILDNRYNKKPYATWPFRLQSFLPESDFLGEDQWAWLEKTLAESKSDVNIIASGLQVLPEYRWQGENWARFPLARARLMQTIMRAGAKGSIILSGDVHFAEVSTALCRQKGGGGMVRELWDFTSSGLTHSWESAHAHLLPYFQFVFGVSPFKYMRGEVWTGMNIGVLDVHVPREGTPTARVAILSPDGVVRLSADVDISGGGGGGGGGTGSASRTMEWPR